MFSRLGLSLIVIALLSTAVGASGSATPRIQQAATDMAIRTGTQLLASWIDRARDEAIAEGVRTPPQRIITQLCGYFAKPLLRTVRYRIGWSEQWTMNSSVFRLSHARAIALGDVIVFRDAVVAADPVIWAHELTHIQQYQRWGVHGFAETYIRSRDAVETEAWKAAAEYTMWGLEHGIIRDTMMVYGEC